MIMTEKEKKLHNWVWDSLSLSHDTKERLFVLVEDVISERLDRLTQENKQLREEGLEAVRVGREQVALTLAALETAHSLQSEVQQIRQQLQQREFDVMTFCSILGLQAEEELEPILRKLSSEIRKLSNEKKVDSNLQI